MIGGHVCRSRTDLSCLLRVCNLHVTNLRLQSIAIDKIVQNVVTVLEIENWSLPLFCVLVLAWSRTSLGSAKI